MSINTNMDNFYVYKLVSSLDNKTVYIGKGKNQRMYNHKRIALLNKHDNKKLERKILKIIKSGGDVLCEKIVENLNEQEALEIEKQVIGQIGLVNLCNLSPGGVGGDCITNHPDYQEICKRMGDTRRGKKRTESEVQAVVQGRQKWLNSEEFKNWRQQRSKIQKDLGEENPLVKYIKQETSEQKKQRMASVLSLPRWSTGLTKDNSLSLKRISEYRKGKIPANAEKCKVINIHTDEIIVFDTVSDFKKFLKETYGTLNHTKLQKHLNGVESHFKDFKVIDRKKYDKLTERPQ